MTDREKAIVMAYTGIAMLTGEKIDEFYKYLAELYGRPVYTHEIVTLDIQEKAKPDFVELCRTEQSSAQPERKKGKWVDETFEFEPWWVVHHPYKCNQCGERSEEDSNFCPNCGAKMKGGDE